MYYPIRFDSLRFLRCPFSPILAWSFFSLSISFCLCPTLYRLPRWLTRLSIRFILPFAYRCRLCRSIHSDSIWSHRRFTRKNRFHFADSTRRWNTKWFLLHFSYQHLDTDLLRHYISFIRLQFFRSFLAHFSFLSSYAFGFCTRVSIGMYLTFVCITKRENSRFCVRKNFIFLDSSRDKSTETIGKKKHARTASFHMDSLASAKDVVHFCLLLFFRLCVVPSCPLRSLRNSFCFRISCRVWMRCARGL